MNIQRCGFRVTTLGFAWLLVVGWAWGAEVVQLDKTNFEEYTPAGKEVDCIYGDHVLRNKHLVAVVAQTKSLRHANMFVQYVGGSVIDLTRRDVESDQLSCYYPLAREFSFWGPVEWPSEWEKKSDAAQLAFMATPNLRSGLKSDEIKTTVGYELAEDAESLTVLTLLVNQTDKPIVLKLGDEVRAVNEFEFGHDAELNLWWCHDKYWRGAYGLTSPLFIPKPTQPNGRRIDFQANAEEASTTLPAKGSYTLRRQLIPAANTLDLAAVVRKQRSEKLAEVNVFVGNSLGPVADADVQVLLADRVQGNARTDDKGQLSLRLTEGEYQWEITAQGHQALEVTTVITASNHQFDFHFGSPEPGYAIGQITDVDGKPIPCKIAFHGRGVDDPDFGPPSAVHGVKNLWYTSDGKFRVTLKPGEYEILISHGPEYDAVTSTIAIEAGKDVRIEETMIRTVNTAGWLSAELHSHSSPSGDNTSSQRGRVLNLLAEQLEFIPCTEHQRIMSYEPHLEYFDAVDRVLTCAGMELTGSPLPVNHQNAFPLIHHPHTQDGGAPRVNGNPEVQIARLAMWDDKSDKVVQINHPNIAQIIGDADGDGKPDQGFRKMFAHTDVIEVHPLASILASQPIGKDELEPSKTPVRKWLQLLNLGYRIPGVINTDAHWNFHGSGWRRNYVRSTTDNPAEAELMDVCHALERGNIVMTNGPFLEVEASSGEAKAGPGEDLAASDSIELRVRVECANWLDVNRVQIFVNGKAEERYNFTRRTHPQFFENTTVKFQQTIPLSLTTDAHVIVVAAGEGLQLGKIYGAREGAAMPIAVSNPIFIDLDGNGFLANGDALGVPLPVEAAHIPTHGHSHVHPHHHP